MDDYGILGSIQSLTTFLPVVLSLAIDSAFNRFFHDVKKDHRKTQELVSTVYWFSLGYGGLMLAVVLVTSKLWIKDLLTIPVWPYAVLAFVPVLFLQLANLGIVFLQQSLKSKQVTLLQVAHAFIYIGIILILLIGFKIGLLAYLLGAFAGAIFFFICTTYIFLRNDLLIFSFDKNLLKAGLFYSLPLIPGQAGMWIANLSDKLVIAKYIDLSSVAIYSVAYQIGMVPYVLHDILTLVQNPMSLSGLIYDKENTKKKIAAFSLQLWVFMLVVNLGLLLFTGEVLKIFFDDSYYSAVYLIPIIGFSYVFAAQYRIYAVTIAYVKRTWITSAAAILSALLNLGLNIVFVPEYGNYAAAISTVFSFFLYTIWLFYWSQKFEKVDYSYSQMAYTLLAYILVSGVGVYLIMDQVSIENFLLKIVVFVLFSLYCYWPLKHTFSFNR